MQIKFMAFFIFVWFIGMIWGSSYEGQNLNTYNRQSVIMSTGNTTMTTSKTFNYLFDFSSSSTETTLGSVFWKLAQPDYYFTWFSVLTLDFSFLKNVDAETGETTETIQSYFFKALGIIGMLCFILMFIDVIQGFIPS
jgi:small-conductance mechanosensitive channel